MEQARIQGRDVGRENLMAIRGRQIDVAHGDVIGRLDAELKKILDKAPKVMSRKELDLRLKYVQIVNIKPNGLSTSFVS